MEPLRADDPRGAGEFRLRARLGAGGMGRVYLGMSPAGRAVAVKVIHPELARDTEFVARFRSEVAAAQAVNGIYTAQVVAAGLYDHPPWLATAYIPGPTLDQLVDERGPLPEAALWRLAAGLAEALRAVHIAGLVHRDLKPTNVLMAEDGPRVIDFGVSRALDGTSATRTGTTFGTPPFMSPEQARGLPVGPASDVFSLGSVLCFAATGQPPFGDGNALSVLYRIVNEQPDINGIPGGLRDLAARCLGKDPASRPGLPELTAALAARTEEWDGSFWPANVLNAIRGYRATDRPAAGTPAPAIAKAATTRPPSLASPTLAPAAPARTPEPGPTPEPARASEPGLASEPASTPAPTPEPALSRRRVFAIAGGLGGVIVAGAVGWELSRPNRKSGSAQTGSAQTGSAGLRRATSQTGTSLGKIRWHSDIDAIQLAAADGVVVAMVGANKGYQLAAMDSATGAHLWTSPNMLIQLLRAQGDTVVVTAWDGPFRVIGLDARSGKQLWSNVTGSEVATMALSGDLCVCPAAGNAGAVSAYRLRTGAMGWTFGFPGQPTKWPAYIAAAGGSFYVANSTEKIWQVGADGRQLGGFIAPAPNPRPLVVAGGVLFGVGNGGDEGRPKRLYALEVSSGRHLWSTQLDPASHTMTEGAGAVYVADMADNGAVVALSSWNASTGAPGWRHAWPDNSAVAAGPLAIAGGTVLTGIRQTLLGLNAATGKEQWQLTLDGDIQTIAVQGNMAYITAKTNDRGRAYAVQV